MAKITMATLKAFIKKNQDNLFVRVKSSFSGMTDCVEMVEDSFRKVNAENAIGHGGIWCVGSSRDYITKFENNDYSGFEVSNCCGHGIIAAKKTR